MTYIEFFDESALENISTCLTNKPDRVIYIGNDLTLMNKHIDNYKKVLSARNFDIEFISKTVPRSKLESAINVLSDIVEQYDDCVFDITGGDEMYTLALGIVYANHPNRGIQIHKMNLKNNSVYDCDRDGKTVFKETPVLSVEENIRLYGGDVLYGAVDEDETYKWDLTEDFLRDVGYMWDVCKKNVREWNTVINIIDAVEQAGKAADEIGLTTVAKMAAVEQKLGKYKYKYPRGIVESLLKKGMLRRFDDSDGEKVTVSYKNKQVKRCLTKAGQILEMKIFLTAKSVTDKDNNVYNDIVNGVVIDWDGIFHDEVTENKYDTENEIDVMMMHGVVPVFISCKNGEFTADELYKLNTVAECFGGKYSKKVLVSTAIDTFKKNTKEYLKQRIKDMDIKLISNVQAMNDGELAKELKSIVKN